jgi:Zn-dependent alcohol dehydrogenase
VAIGGGGVGLNVVQGAAMADAEAIIAVDQAFHTTRRGGVTVAVGSPR